jgi:1-phosphofructokinase
MSGLSSACFAHQAMEAVPSVFEPFPGLPLENPSMTVFAPSPVVTVTIETGTGSEPDIHLHAGGQGFWVARMAARLGADVNLCVPLGGESGTVLRPLLGEAGITVLSVRTEGANGAYVHDRRSGVREVMARTSSPSLARHEVDDLYGVTIAAAMDSDVTLVTGPRNDGVLPDGFFERLCRDLRANGRIVLADLSGRALNEALRGGLDLVKVSDDELVQDGRIDRRDLAPTLAAARQLQSEGAVEVLVTRSAEPSLMLTGDDFYEIDSPHFTPVDEHGAGDSLFAGTGVAVGAGLPISVAVKLGVAAGALNVARRGLGTGRIREVSRLADQVQISHLKVPSRWGA